MPTFPTSAQWRGNFQRFVPRVALTADDSSNDNNKGSSSSSATSGASRSVSSLQVVALFARLVVLPVVVAMALLLWPVGLHAPPPPPPPAANHTAPAGDYTTIALPSFMVFEGLYNTIAFPVIVSLFDFVLPGMPRKGIAAVYVIGMLALQLFFYFYCSARSMQHLGLVRSLGTLFYTACVFGPYAGMCVVQQWRARGEDRSGDADDRDADAMSRERLERESVLCDADGATSTSLATREASMHAVSEHDDGLYSAGAAGGGVVSTGRIESFAVNGDTMRHFEVLLARPAPKPPGTVASRTSVETTAPSLNALDAPLVGEPSATASDIDGGFGASQRSLGAGDGSGDKATMSERFDALLHRLTGMPLASLVFAAAVNLCLFGAFFFCEWSATVLFSPAHGMRGRYINVRSPIVSTLLTYVAFTAAMEGMCFVAKRLARCADAIQRTEHIVGRHAAATSLEYCAEILMGQFHATFFRALFTHLEGWEEFAIVTALHVALVSCLYPLRMTRWYFTVSSRIQKRFIRGVPVIGLLYDPSNGAQWNTRLSLDFMCRFVSAVLACTEYLCGTVFLRYGYNRRYYEFYGDGLTDREFFQLVCFLGLSLVVEVLVAVGVVCASRRMVHGGVVRPYALLLLKQWRYQVFTIAVAAHVSTDVLLAHVKLTHTM